MPHLIKIKKQRYPRFLISSHFLLRHIHTHTHTYSSLTVISKWTGLTQFLLGCSRLSFTSFWLLYDCGLLVIQIYSSTTRGTKHTCIHNVGVSFFSLHNTERPRYKHIGWWCIVCSSIFRSRGANGRQTFACCVLFPVSTFAFGFFVRGRTLVFRISNLHVVIFAEIRKETLIAAFIIKKITW